MEPISEPAISADPSPVNIERERIKIKEYEYENAEGNYVCTAEVMLQEIPAADRKNGMEDWRELKDLRLYKKDEPDSQPLDVLAETNKHNVRIFVDPQSTRPKYLHKARIAHVPPLDNLFGLTVTMHELGHADQMMDDNISPYGSLYLKKKQLESFSAESMQYHIQRVLKLVPELEGKINQKVHAELVAAADKGRDVRKIEQQISDTEHTKDKYFAALLLNNVFTDEFLQKLFSLTLENPGQKPEPAEVTALLEELGFIFSDQAPIDSQEEDSSFYDFALDEEPEAIDGLPLLPRSTISDSDSVYGAMYDLKRNLSPSNCALEYDEENQRAILRFSSKHLMGASDQYQCQIAFTLTPEKFQSQMDAQAEADRQIAELLRVKTKELEQLKEQTQMLREHPDIQKIMFLPRYIKERDATRRALLWLRSFKKENGIDLLSSFKMQERSRSNHDDDCSSATQAGMEDPDELITTTPRQEVDKALKKHGAHKSTKRLFS